MSVSFNTPGMESQQLMASSTQGSYPTIDTLPFEIIEKILGYLPPSEDCKNAQVCRLWRRVVKDLPDPSLKVIGSKIWNEYRGFEIEGKIPPLPTDIRQMVRSVRRSLAGEKEAPTCTAYLMPKGLTANKVIELLRNPKIGRKAEVNTHVFNYVDVLPGENPVEESYWFVMTDDVIQETRGIPYELQKSLIKEKTKNEWELPTYQEALVACVMHYLINGRHLLGREIFTFTSCQDLVDKGHVDIGGFDIGGTAVLSASVKSSHVNDIDDGAVARRKFGSERLLHNSPQSTREITETVRGGPQT